jgi:hypothetical protein
MRSRSGGTRASEPVVTMSSPRPAAVAAASVIGRVKDASETGAGLVGDRVQSD